MASLVPLVLARPYIRLVMDRLGWKQNDVAKAGNVTQASVSQWLNTEDLAREITADPLRRIQRKSRVPFPDDLAAELERDDVSAVDDELADALELVESLTDLWGVTPTHQQRADAIRRIRAWRRQRENVG